MLAILRLQAVSDGKGIKHTLELVRLQEHLTALLGTFHSKVVVGSQLQEYLTIGIASIARGESRRTTWALTTEHEGCEGWREDGRDGEGFGGEAIPDELPLLEGEQRRDELQTAGDDRLADRLFGGIWLSHHREGIRLRGQRRETEGLVERREEHEGDDAGSSSRLGRDESGEKQEGGENGSEMHDVG